LYLVGGNGDALGRAGRASPFAMGFCCDGFFAVRAAASSYRQRGRGRISAPCLAQGRKSKRGSGGGGSVRAQLWSMERLRAGENTVGVAAWRGGMWAAQGGGCERALWADIRSGLTTFHGAEKSFLSRREPQPDRRLRSEPGRQGCRHVGRRHRAPGGQSPEVWTCGRGGWTPAEDPAARVLVRRMAPTPRAVYHCDGELPLASEAAARAELSIPPLAEPVCLGIPA